jgi:hypothetical protein
VKRPAFQFYPGDWLRSTDLRACSVGARGLWIDMLCLMHEGNPYGYLKVGGKVIHQDNLSRMVGATFAETEGWLKELRDAGVCSTDEAGCIYSRRMVRDEQIRLKRAAGGLLGGNPALLNGGKKINGKDNHPSNLQPTPAVASASASASPKKHKTNGRPRNGAADPPGFGAFWTAYPRKKARQTAVEAWLKLDPDSELQAKILTAVSVQAQSQDWQQELQSTGGKHIPHAATWLNQRRWEDELLAPAPTERDAPLVWQ